MLGGIAGGLESLGEGNCFYPEGRDTKYTKSFMLAYI